MKLRVSQDAYLINDQCSPPVMKVQPCDIEVLIETLGEHRLVTNFSFPDISRDSDSPMWAEFDQKLRDYLLSIDADFADPASFSSFTSPIPPNQNPPTAYHHLPWILLTGARLSRERRRIVPAGAPFTPKTLCSNTVGGVWGRSATPGTPNWPLILIGASF